MIQADRAYEQAEIAKQNSTNASNEANSAYSEAERAKGYADKAKTSEDNVSTMKASVEATKTEVDNIKTTVASYRDATATSATNAANSAANAANEASKASTSATNATNSATNAANSATEAANSAAEAKTYKDQAKAIVGSDFLTTTDASNTYLKKADASQTYATSENLNNAVTRLSTAESNITSLTNNKADKTTVSTIQTQVDSNTNAITTKQPKGNYATVEYIDGRVANLVNSAPETLDTLNELANALGNDPNFATTVSTQIGQKANKTDVDSQIQNVNTQLSQAITTLKNGVVSSIEGKNGEVNLWDVLHRYGENYVPTDTSNRGWNSLGVCIIYYAQNVIKNQPTQYGQLINIPANKDTESMQIWVSQYDGKLYTRGGDTDNIVNDRMFVPVGREDRVYLTNGAQIWVE